MANLTWAATSDGSLATDSNWKPINIRNSSYQWTVSASGTNEYYLEAAGGGNPSIGEPDNVQEGGSNMTPGTAGSLAAGEWDWADNDTLGYSTVYVRLTAGGPDPDSEPDGDVTFTRDPVGSDTVTFLSNAYAVNAGLDTPSVTLTRVDIASSYTGDIGTSSGDEWHVGVTTLNVGIPLGSGNPAGSDRLLFDLGSVASTVNVYKTATTAADTNREALRIRGTSSSNVITVHDGLVGIGTNDVNDTANFALNQFGGTVNCGIGVTLYDVLVDGTTSVLRIRNGLNSGDVLTIKQGTVYSYGTATIPTVKLVDNGVFYDESTGTVTTCTIGNNATVYTTSAAKTYTTMNLYGTLDLSDAKGAITVTTFNVLDESAKVIDPYNLLPTNTDFVLGAGIKTFDYQHGGGVTVRRQS